MYFDPEMLEPGLTLGLSHHIVARKFVKFNIFCRHFYRPLDCVFLVNHLPVKSFPTCRSGW